VQLSLKILYLNLAPFTEKVKTTGLYL